ncbi:hypothetical protein HGRIS_009078 [Hohenbuehelia grisea]|uniref:Uncharacterized protein n=1 Tax=Hohenbuehelia grisea TaxID=104357 RepID=A0ABR3J059_9AGAR
MGYASRDFTRLFCLVLVAASLGAASPLKNDWDTACLNGECAYVVPAGPEPGALSGTLKLFGSPQTLTDITPAAGWVVLDCHANGLEQEIRLVCKSEEEAGCQHLFAHDGPLNKIVRLPESCSRAPFARVAQASVAKNQAIPSHAEGKLSRRDGVPPVVHTLKIDTNFAAVEEAGAKPVYFIFQGGNIPGLHDKLNFDGPNQLNVEAENFDIGGWFSKRWSELKSTVKNVYDKVEDTIAKATTIGFDQRKSFDALNVNFGPKEIFKIDGKCDLKPKVPSAKQADISASVRVTASGQGKVTVSVGLVVTGIVSRFQLSKFAAFIGGDVSLNADVNLHAALQGTIESQRQQLFQQGIPGLSIAGFFTVGPAVGVDAYATGSFEVILDVDLHVSYRSGPLEFWFPNEPPKTPKELGPSDSAQPLKVTVVPTISGKVAVEVHVVPRITLGLSFFSAKANLFVEADSSAELVLSGSLSTKARRSLDTSPAEGELVKRSVPPYGLAARDLALSLGDLEAAEITAVKAAWCLAVNLKLAVKGGVEGQFFSFWSGRKETVFFAKTWELFKTGTCAAVKRDLTTTLERRLEMAGPLSCPKSAPTGPPETVANAPIKKASTKLIKG